MIKGNIILNLSFQIRLGIMSRKKLYCINDRPKTWYIRNIVAFHHELCFNRCWGQSFYLSIVNVLPINT